MYPTTHRLGLQRPARHVLAVLTLALLIAGSAGLGNAQSLPTTLPSVSEVAGSAQTGGKRASHNLSTALDRLVQAHAKAPAAAGQDPQLNHIDVNKGKALVTLMMRDDAAADRAVAALPRFGARVDVRFGAWIDAWVPIAELPRVSELAGVRLVREPIRVEPLEQPPELHDVRPAAGPFLSEGVAASTATAWHAAGIDGSGIRIGVIDSFKDATVAQSLGELPASIGAMGAIDVSSPHGTAVAEIIHDMAPGAQLTFATLPNSSATAMATYIQALAELGHHVISSSVGPVHVGPGDGTGPIAEAVALAATTYGTVFVQAAGNQAQFHWDGQFSDSNGNNFHEWAPGIDINRILPGAPVPAGYPIRIYLRWNRWPATNQDYDLFLFGWNGTAWQVVTKSEDLQDGTQPPMERIELPAPATTFYGIGVLRYSATGAELLDLNGFNLPPLEFVEPSRSLVDAATSPLGLSVAAIDAASFNLEPYSSRGPTYGPGGTLAAGVNQPLIAGFANTSTWAYSTQQGKFNGTSAATPHVSGAAALVRQAFPSASPAQVISFLAGRSADQGSPGYDHQFGAGRLLLGDPPIAQPSAPPQPSVPPQPSAPPQPSVPPVSGTVYVPIVASR